METEHIFANLNRKKACLQVFSKDYFWEVSSSPREWSYKELNHRRHYDFAKEMSEKFEFIKSYKKPTEEQTKEFYEWLETINLEYYFLNDEQ